MIAMAASTSMSVVPRSGFRTHGSGERIHDDGHAGQPKAGGRSGPIWPEPDGGTTTFPPHGPPEAHGLSRRRLQFCHDGCGRIPARCRPAEDDHTCRHPDYEEDEEQFEESHSARHSPDGRTL
jgi:hypothetical protein